MLSASNQRREKVLIVGDANSGKSSAWVSIAHWLAKTKSDAKVRVLDTDQAWEAMYDSTIEPVVEVVSSDKDNAEEWPEIMRSFKKRSQPDDWLVVDMIDQPWEAARQWFWKTKEGDSLAEVYLRQASGENVDIGGAYGRNWDVINKIYDDIVHPFFSAPCHKLACTPAQEIWTDKQGLAPNKNDQEWVKFKYKPRGQNRLAHGFHTILLAQRIPSGRDSEWVMTTMKERGPIGLAKREELRGENVTANMGFVGAYLTKVAGWRL